MCRIIPGRFLTNIKIKYKFILFFSIIIFIFICFTTYFLFSKSLDFIIEQKTDTYRQFVVQTNRHIYNTLKSYEKVVNTLYLNKSFKMQLTQEFKNIYDQMEFQKSMRNYIDSLIIAYEPVPRIKIYTANSTLKCDNLTFFSMEDFKQTPWYEMIDGKPERIKIHHWLNPVKTADTPVEVYTICGIVELFDDISGENTAVATLELNVNDLFSFMQNKENDDGNSIMLVNNSGYTIYSSKKEDTGKTINNEKFFKEVLRDKNGSFILPEANRKKLVVFDANTISGWYLINIIDQSILFKEADIVKNYAVFLAILSISVSIITTFLYVNIVTKRIMILTKAMTAVGGGNFDVSVNISGSDEIGRMSSVFTNMVRDTKNLIQRIKDTESSLRRLEITSLQEQIKPHFLYNTLSAIGSMALDIEAHEIYSSIISLFNYYKISLSHGNNIIPVKDELKHIQAYIELLSIRFRNKFNVSYMISDEVYNYYTPKIILQPIVENSLFHGFSNKRAEPGQIILKAEKQENKIIFEISDNGMGMDEKRIREVLENNSDSFALKNTDTRIKLLCGDEYGLSISSRPGEGTTTRIILPVIS